VSVYGPRFVPLADGAQVELIYSLDTEIVENRLWFLTRQPPLDTTQLQNLADGVTTWWTSWLQPLLSSDLILELVRATDWQSPPGGATGFTVPAIVGSVSETAQSASVAIHIAFRAPFGWRFRHNGNFVPGIPNGEIDGNVYSDAIRSGLFEAYAALIDAAPSFGPFPAFRWVGVSEQLDGVLRSEGLPYRVDGPYFPSPYVSPQRRRLPRA